MSKFGYKAFEKGMICRGKQYAENTVFEEEKAVIRDSGMHFCENPLETLKYYPLIDKKGNLTEFAEAEALDEVFTDDNKKFCTKKLRIGAKLSLTQFIGASFSFLYEKTRKEVSEKTWDCKKIDSSTLAGGNFSTLAGGDSSTLAGGDSSTLAGGNFSTLAGGSFSVIVGDHGSFAKGGVGSLLVLIERESNENSDDCFIKSYKAEIVDGERIKADTFYRLVNGEFEEVK